MAFYRYTISAKTGVIKIETINALGGTPDTKRRITLDLSDLPSDGYYTAKFRRAQVCVDGSLRTAYVLMTEPRNEAP